MARGRILNGDAGDNARQHFAADNYCRMLAAHAVARRDTPHLGSSRWETGRRERRAPSAGETISIWRPTLDEEKKNRQCGTRGRQDEGNGGRSVKTHNRMLH